MRLLAAALVIGANVLAGPEGPALQGAMGPAHQAALVVGRVLDALTGQPLPGARVRVMSVTGPRVGFTALTGIDGVFVAERVPPGTYEIAVSRSGYLEGAYGRKRPEGSSLRLLLAPGDRRGGADILMWPMASISGSVVDEQNVPVQGAVVSASRAAVGVDGANDATSIAVTDYAGRYRIDGLPPGRYRVGVACAATTAPVPGDGDPVPPGSIMFPMSPRDRTVVVDARGEWFSLRTGPIRAGAGSDLPWGFVTSYHANTTRESEARLVPIAPGDDAQNVDIVLAGRRAFNVSGRVAGVDAEGAVVMLRATDDLGRTDPDAEPAATAVAAADGRFMFMAVPAGHYVLDVHALRRRPVVRMMSARTLSLEGTLSARREGASFARTTVALSDRDESGITVALGPAATVSGTLVATASLPPDSASLAALVRLRGATETVPLGGSLAFEFTGVPPGRHEASVQRLPPGWGVIAASVNGRDAIDGLVEIGLRDVRDATFTIGPLARLTGTIADAGAPAADATVVLFPAARAAWPSARAGSRFLALRTNSGDYAIDRVVPGDYFVAAVDDAVLAGWPSLDVLGRLAAVALPITLVSGQHRAQPLTLVRTGR